LEVDWGVVDWEEVGLEVGWVAADWAAGWGTSTLLHLGARQGCLSHEGNACTVDEALHLRCTRRGMC
jgi:hypothetical protein